MTNPQNPSLLESSSGIDNPIRELLQLYSEAYPDLAIDAVVIDETYDFIAYVGLKGTGYRLTKTVNALVVMCKPSACSEAVEYLIRAIYEI
jgi:hypothetical protein